jgi:hypothetical protein
MSTPNADAWELAGFPGRLDVAAYLTADQLAAQYRVLVDVLLDAQEHSLTGVGRDELLAAVRDRPQLAQRPSPTVHKPLATARKSRCHHPVTPALTCRNNVAGVGFEPT